jgi:siroheme synthase-like protein
VAPELDPGFEELAEKHENVTLVHSTFQPEALEGQWLVISATDDEGINREVFEACEEARVPCNVVDNPPLCRFHVPARYRDGRLQVAISTGGGSPALGGRLKREFSILLSPWAPRLLDWMEDLRQKLKALKSHDTEWRGRFLYSLVESHAKKLKHYAAENDRGAFEALVEKELRGAEES